LRIVCAYCELSVAIQAGVLTRVGIPPVAANGHGLLITREKNKLLSVLCTKKIKTVYIDPETAVVALGVAPV
jgi:hypothetical protein